MILIFMIMRTTASAAIKIIQRIKNSDKSQDT